MDWHRTFGQILDLLPDVAFFIKDREGRFVMNNRRGCEYCRAASEEETFGKTDADYWSADRARCYSEGDRQVMTTGQPILNAVSPAPEEAGSDRLILYSKVPVRDRAGHVIGVAGIHREIDVRRCATTSYGRIGEAVRLMHSRFAEDLQTPDFARVAGLSPSQFNRRFRALFGTTPREYLLRVRVNAACRFLETTGWTVARVALEAGFFDHSHFIRIFRRLMGLTPSAYRKMHAPT
jgi:AraC-like DNA-binding protein